jgi:hypothetical protein
VCAASVTGHSAVDATNYNKEFKWITINRIWFSSIVKRFNKWM